ncbi:MAG: hypothetical protein V2I54_07900 [Bacteroidales bacterium]|nr:hypothetical protein [Bacteroidales bacterium]
MNDLQDEQIICMVNVLLNIDEEISHYKYFIENENINGIVDLTQDKWRKIPVSGEITAEDFCVSYFLKHENYESEGIISRKLKMNKDNYFRFKIKNQKIFLDRMKNKKIPL